MKPAPARWSSWFAFNLAAVGAAVGLAAEFIIGSRRDDLLKNPDLIRAIGL